MLTPAYLRQHLGGTPSPSDDRVLVELEAGAVGRVESETRRTFRAPAELVEYYDGDGEQTLELRAPVIAGEDFEVAIRSLGATWTTLDSAAYYVRRNDRLGIMNLVTLLSLRWPVGHQNIRVTYTGGYAPGEEPAQIRNVVEKLVSLLYAGRIPGAEQGALPADMVADLARWRYVETPQQPRLVRA